MLQVPAIDGRGSKHNIACDLDGMQGKRLRVTVPERVLVSTPVSVEYEDTLFLGEVVLCTSSGEKWNVEVRVEQMLNGLQSLMRLRAHLLSDSVSAPLPLFPVGLRN